MKKQILFFGLFISCLVYMVYHLVNTYQGVEGVYVNIGNNNLELTLSKSGTYSYFAGSQKINEGEYLDKNPSIVFNNWIDYTGYPVCDHDICHMVYHYDGCCNLIISDDVLEMNFVRKSDMLRDYEM